MQTGRLETEWERRYTDRQDRRHMARQASNSDRVHSNLREKKKDSNGCFWRKHKSKYQSLYMHGKEGIIT